LGLLFAPSVWAFSFVAASPVTSSSDNTGITSATCDLPTGTADDDFLLAVIHSVDGTLSSAPSGWDNFGSPVVGQLDPSSSAAFTHLYWKIASGEPASYSWSWASSARSGCSVYSFRDDFDVSNPVDAISNTAYTTSSTTVRAASATAAAANAPIILFSTQHVSSSQTCTAHPTSPTTFTAHSDLYNSSSRFHRCLSIGVWSGSGSTGDMDTSISNTAVDKRGFALILNPSGAPAAPEIYSVD